MSYGYGPAVFLSIHIYVCMYSFDICPLPLPTKLKRQGLPLTHHHIPNPKHIPWHMMLLNKYLLNGRMIQPVTQSKCHEGMGIHQKYTGHMCQRNYVKFTHRKLCHKGRRETHSQTGKHHCKRNINYLL